MDRMPFIFDDGGREAAGYTGKTGDCVVRAIAIAAELPYQQVYDDLHRAAKERSAVRWPKPLWSTRHDDVYRAIRRRSLKQTSPRNGVGRDVYRPYLEAFGWTWTPTMGIGSGCRVHLWGGELPQGRLIVRVSKHLTAVIDGTVHDAFDPQREVYCMRPDDGGALRDGESRNSNGIHNVERRCVYGYFSRGQ